jgi:demethylmacrocin O-methyltransferase
MSILTQVSHKIGNGLTARQKRGYRSMQRLWARASCGNSLSELARFYHSDKVGGHHYTQHYERHFQSLRKHQLKVLEIGIGGNDDSHAGGSSLRMWRDYFPRSMIYGIDLYDKSWHDESRIKTFQGSQGDEAFLLRVIESIGKPDIIIDDGSHRSEHVLTTFKALFQKLAAQGIYAVEDTQTSYWTEYGGNETNLNDPNTTMGFFKSLIDGLNVDEFRRAGDEASYFDRHITGFHFYHNLVFVQKGKNNEGSFKY